MLPIIPSYYEPYTSDTDARLPRTICPLYGFNQPASDILRRRVEYIIRGAVIRSNRADVPSLARLELLRTTSLSGLWIYDSLQQAFMAIRYARFSPDNTKENELACAILRQFLPPEAIGDIQDELQMFSSYCLILSREEHQVMGEREYAQPRKMTSLWHYWRRQV